MEPKELLTQEKPPWWGRLVERSPSAFFSLVFLGLCIWLVKEGLSDVRTGREAFLKSLDANTAAVGQLAKTVGERCLFAPDLPTGPDLRRRTREGR
jgi:hypothetical protein